MKLFELQAVGGSEVGKGSLVAAAMPTGSEDGLCEKWKNRNRVFAPPV